MRARLFAYTDGPYEGAYSVHVQHMAVKRPRNLNHEDLETHDPAFERAVGESTVMSFHLERIKVAIVCREVMDELWGLSIDPNPETLPYEKVAALDVKFRGLIEGLPKFLQFESTIDSLRQEYGEKADNWQMTVLRASINLMIHARRCKLHLTFLIHFKPDPPYDISREICLESARKVFQVCRKVEMEQTSPGSQGFLKLGGQLSHIFYAAFVLIMDLCVNKNSDSQEQFAAVRDAIQLKEEAKTSSKVAHSCYESLMGTLRKHQVNLPSVRLISGTSLHSALSRAPGTTVAERTTTSTAAPTSIDGLMMNPGNAFKDVWQNYMDYGASLDPQSWEGLIKDLEMHII